MPAEILHSRASSKGEDDRIGYLHTPDGYAKVSQGGNLAIHVRRAFIGISPVAQIQPEPYCISKDDLLEYVLGPGSV